MKSLLLAFLASTASVFAQGIYAIVDVEFTNDAPPNDYQFVIELDYQHAPRNVGLFMLLAETETRHFRSKLATTVNNPHGEYVPADANGTLLPGGTAYTIVAANSSANPPSATLFLSATSSKMATFTNNNGTWTSDNPYVSLFYNGSTMVRRFMIKEDPKLSYLDEVTGEVTSGPFYDNEDILRITGEHPYLSLGKKTFGTNNSPGWSMQNEMIDQFHNDFNDSAGPWGDRFSNAAGIVGPSQQFAVALANRSLLEPNTAGAEILITGVAGNPDFRGRHTHIGRVVSGPYTGNTNPSTYVPSSRAVVQTIINGEPAKINSITFENQNVSNFHPIALLGENDDNISLPTISLSTSRAELDFSPLTGPRVLTGAQPGEIRYLDASTDLESWNRVGQSSYPIDGSAESGFDLTPTLAANQRGFFRTSATVSTYPDWPAEEFAEGFPNAFFKFKGRENEEGTASQVLNIFNLYLNAAGTAGILAGLGGDLQGEYSIDSVDYQASGPFRGNLTLDGPNLPEPLRLRLYFDSHRTGEINSGQPLINRFHRLVTREVNGFPFEQAAEFGIWVQER
ncbi:hypothetical protein [Roseibacillus ishigakijimensis]|uniref:Uncharacterized protein n=1 Tax=Roseibacillus ishigakijimensis TaxID=454146 RepID=A0A934RLF6_9BACT|nr:hypothetical protein [Roseibacillus ishigakijimensis]MBK1832930.1 hypothetical protein [Roseibacillus ishigakijimensis]